MLVGNEVSLVPFLLFYSVKDIHREDTLLSEGQKSSEFYMKLKRSFGGIIDTNSLKRLKEKRDLFYILSFIVHNTKPVGHQVSALAFDTS